MTTPTIGPPSATCSGTPAGSGTRLWRRDRTSIAPTVTLAAALGAGALAALVLRVDTPGFTYPLVGLVVAGAAVVAGRPRPSRGHLLAVAVTVAMLSVATVRGAGWLIALCVVAGWVVGSVALLGVRRWTGIGLAPFAVWCTPTRLVGWVRRRGGRRGTGVRLRAPRVLGVVAVSAVLVTVFGWLFAEADPEFGRMLGGVAPSVHTDDLTAGIVTGSAVVVVSLALAYLWRRPIRLDRLAPPPRRPVAAWEWAVPLLALVLLFAGFVAVQVRVMFGGHEHVMTTPGLTYAQYARQGFWQLCAVTVLTLVVIAIAVRRVNRGAARDRALARVLFGMLCLLAIVVVASALHRMSLYENAFGYTRLRLSVWAVELWFGVVFGVLLVAGIRMRGDHLPRVVLGSAAAGLLIFAAVNPDGLVADRNVERYERTGSIDVSYLRGLTVDAVPALDRLPEPVRSCALRGTRVQPDAWYEFNAARARAREILRERPVGPSASCADTVTLG
ncbi:DUF4153 domain-containing protein [Rhodococcus gannanensis]|uniref:DUF4153 domain-containing protein n=1 Tax=Rhodococcus gannanensis TaxID=1960308 RepID=A0ABW4P4A5_9NOCA